MPCVFSPPTDNVIPPVYIAPYDPNSGRDPSGYFDVEPAMQKLMRHYAPRPQGRNVYLMMDGTVTEVQPPQWDPGNPTGPVTQGYNPFTHTTDTTTLPASQQVRRIFFGGVANPVDATEEAILTAAGYTVDCAVYSDVYTDGYGTAY